MSNLRSTILQNSLPHIPTHSFTLHPLKLALGSHLASSSSLASNTFAPESSGSEGTDVNSMITHLFGSSPGPEKALVDVWEKEGLRGMTGSGSNVQDGVEGRVGSTGSGLGEVLGRRLRYSSLVGEHLVQAHAVIQSPSSSVTLPFPQTLGYLIDTFKLLPTYTPPLQPSASSSSSASPPAGQQPTSTSDPTSNAAHHLPLILPPNPLRSFIYGFKIADEALAIVSSSTQSPTGQAGLGEQVGVGLRGKEEEERGLDWYIRRMVLAGVFLRAESILLDPSSTLPQAEARLGRSLKSYRARYPDAKGRAEGVIRGNAVPLSSFLGFVGKSWGGLFRSRGWID